VWTGVDAFCRCPAASADGSARYFGLDCTVVVPQLYSQTATVVSAAVTVLGREDVAILVVPSAAAVLNAPVWAATLEITLSAYRCSVMFALWVKVSQFILPERRRLGPKSA
jgi:hypothetical protein